MSTADQTSGGAHRSARTASSGTAVAPPPDMVFLRFDVLPLGDGTYKLTPRKPVAAVEEVNSEAAMKILSLPSRSGLYYARDSALGARFLRWRYVSDRKGKILWRVQSLLDYLAALRELDH